MRRIFEPVAERRITAAELLKDPWVVKLAGNDNNLEKEGENEEVRIE